MHVALSNAGFAVDLLTDSASASATTPTKRAILASVQAQVAKALDDHASILVTNPSALPPFLVFYIACHGLQAPDGRQYFIPNLSDACLQGAVPLESLYVWH